MHTMFKIRPVSRAIWAMFGVPPLVHQSTKIAVREVMLQQAEKLKSKK